MTDIVNRGRGPEIAGTRITVFNVLDYYLDGWQQTAIAATLRLSSRQVRAALDYVKAHEAEIMEQYRKILSRIEKGNPPEILAKQRDTHARFTAMKRKLARKRRRPEKLHEGNSRRQ
ncbi:MAG: DUF433 domain-containing protein [Gemmataceae bacterium]|nr:DUF433 domain-containing protein [Gemmataceae bacterium]